MGVPEVTQGTNIIDACKEAGVKFVSFRFVLGGFNGGILTYRLSL